MKLRKTFFARAVSRRGALLLAAVAVCAGCDATPIAAALDAAPAPIDASAPRGDLAAPTGPPDLLPPCDPLPAASYGLIGINGPPTDRPAAQHPDINLLLRKWRVASGAAAMIFDPHHPEDPNGLPPQLNTLFDDQRQPALSNLYQVEALDWSCVCWSGYLTDPPVTLAGFGTTPGEVLHVPASVYVIDPPDYAAMVLYAADDTITLKYTTEDSVSYGYTIHLAGICVDPALRSAYEAADAAGRAQLPGLHRNQAFGRARGGEIQVAIRDTGTWMDPRWCPDWWMCP